MPCFLVAGLSVPWLALPCHGVRSMFSRIDVQDVLRLAGVLLIALGSHYVESAYADLLWYSSCLGWPLGWLPRIHFLHALRSTIARRRQPDAGLPGMLSR